MKFTLLRNFVPSETYDGTLGSDSHGNFILFDVNEIPFNWDICGQFLKTENDTYCVKQVKPEKEDSHVVALKAYY